MAAVAARALALAVAAVEVARPGRGSGRRGGRDARRGAADRWRAQQLRPLEPDDALAAQPVGHLHRGREWSWADEQVAEEIGRRPGRWPVAGRRRHDVGYLCREAAQPRRHGHAARLRDAGIGDRQRESAALGAIPHGVAGDVIPGLREPGRGEGYRTEQRDEPYVHPVHDEATRLADAVANVGRVEVERARAISGSTTECIVSPLASAVVSATTVPSRDTRR